MATAERELQAARQQRLHQLNRAKAELELSGRGGGAVHR